MRRKQQITGRFQVKDDHGHMHMITAVTHYFQTTSLDGPSQWTVDLTEHQVDTGGIAKKLSETQFQLLDSGRMATRV